MLTVSRMYCQSADLTPSTMVAGKKSRWRRVGAAQSAVPFVSSHRGSCCDRIQELTVTQGRLGQEGKEYGSLHADERRNLANGIVTVS